MGLVKHVRVNLQFHDAVFDEAFCGRFDLPGHNAVVVEDVFFVNGFCQLESFFLVRRARLQLPEATAGKPEVQQTS